MTSIKWGQNTTFGGGVFIGAYSVGAPLPASALLGVCMLLLWCLLDVTAAILRSIFNRNKGDK